MDEVERYGVSGGPGGAEGIDLDAEYFEPTPYMLDWWPVFT